MIQEISVKIFCSWEPFYFLYFRSSNLESGMNYVTAENLTKSYGIKVLFKNISFNVNEGDKIAIVAKTEAENLHY